MEGLYIFLIVNALIGLLLFEYAWAKVRKVREINEERDSLYPAFRRYDAKKWSKWRFYIGAVTFMPIRLILSIVPLIFCYLLVK